MGERLVAEVTDYAVRSPTTRIDCEVNAGDPLLLLVPLVDSDGNPVTVDAPTASFWLVRATVRRNVLASAVLYEWSSEGIANAVLVPGSPAHVQLVADGSTTGSWQDTWPTYRCGWDVDVTEPFTGANDPDGGPTPSRIASGRFTLIPQYTR